MKAMCAFLGVSRAAYYAWLRRLDEPDRDAPRLELVQQAYCSSHRTYGYRRISLWLQQKQGVVINPKAVLRLMHKLNIRSCARRRRIGWNGAAELGIVHRYPNRLGRDFVARRPNQKWVTDVTFVALRGGWGYLSVIKDLFDGFIIAHEFGRQNSVALVERTLQQACQNEKVTAELTLHSDQGYQYTSQAYAVLTRTYHLLPSMSRRGNCWDNAPMESFFSQLKEEYLRHLPPPSFEEAHQAIDEYVSFYNYERIQLKTKQTPFERRCLSH
jgi:transposase InsO family protein